jgi:ElaB/YqjD/DUF883 family membrane-anchored ribosome-binding protein
MTDPNAPRGPGPAGSDSEAAREASADVERGREELRRRGEAQAEDAKQQAAGTVGTVSSSLHAAADRLGDEDHLLEGQVRGAADALGNLADRLQGQSVEATLRDVEDFGRRNPALFMGLAVAVGIGLGRLGTARPPERRAGAASEGGGLTR